MDTTTDRKFPRDIEIIVASLPMLVAEATDLWGEEAVQWHKDLHEAYRSWVRGGQEPDWNGFRLEMNEICEDDGSPHLFEIEEQLYD
jgi:hypothetical protein